MIKALFLVSAVFVLSNCAASRPDFKQSKVDVSKLAIVCTREVPTGSHLPVKICRSREQIELDRKNGIGMFGESLSYRNAPVERLARPQTRKQ